MIRFKAKGLVILIGAVIALAGCAAPSRYMGISLTPGTADASIQQQARQAMAGDKQAQLDLGIRFEEGAGVARDLTAAKKLYRQAASDSGGLIWVYTPPVGNGTSGRVVAVKRSSPSPVYAMAKERLERFSIILDHIRTN